MQLQSSMIQAQDSVINLQGELPKCKNDKLLEVSVVVEKAVQQTVKTEIQTYSRAVEESVAVPQVAVNSVQTAIREAAVEEARNRTLMIFGLEEGTGEQLSDQVSNLFEHLGEKPRHESLRLGVKCSAGKHRPVKVKLPTPDHANRISKQAKTLKQSSCYSSVFIAPDRTKSEREDRRAAVAALKKKIHDEQAKHHCIRKGIIVSRDGS